jgi:hypothetical protein
MQATASGSRTIGIRRHAPYVSTRNPASRLLAVVVTDRKGKNAVKTMRSQPFNALRCAWWKMKSVPIAGGAMMPEMMA